MRAGQRIARATTIAALGLTAASLAAAWSVGVAPATSAALGLPDAGSLTHWMLPASRVLRDFSMATVIGALFLASFVVAPGAAGRGLAGVELDACLSVARRACSVWLVSGFAVVAFTYSELIGRPLSDVSLVQFNYFLTDFPLSKALLFNLAAAVLIPLLLAVGHVLAFRGLATLLAVVSTWPLATIGHAAGAANHDHAVNMQAIHIVAVSVWFGGLITLLAVWNQIGEQRLNVVSRYSRIAGWAFGLVAASGVVAAVIRVGSWSGLNTSYGLLVLVKAALLVGLGLMGWWHRKRYIAQIEAPNKATKFWRLAACEVLILLTALSAGVALGNTPPPQEIEPKVTRAEALLGYPLPDALTAGKWITTWRVDSLWVPIGLLAIGVYLAWVRRLRNRGDKWPLARTITWCAGWMTVIWATSGAPGVYGDVLFSVHMIQHMTIATTSPILMVLGAPITLALRAIPRRSDASSGPREWLLYVVHSKLARLIGNPLVAAGLFIVGLIAFYYSGLFEQSLRSHTAHNLMLLHFMVSGYLFASVICGVDPGIRRPAYPMRILLVMVTFGFHALFAISLMNATELLAGDWFPSLGRDWGATSIEDQKTGASIGWLLGDYPLAILAGALIWGWVRDDSREARRLDRQADRDGDAATNSYNAYLHAISTRTGRRPVGSQQHVPQQRQSGQGATAPDYDQEKK